MKTRSSLHRPRVGGRNGAPHPDPLPIGLGEGEGRRKHVDVTNAEPRQSVSPHEGSRRYVIKASSPLPSPPLEEREKALGAAADELQWSKSHSVKTDGGAGQRGRLLLLSEDEVFCWKLLVAASRVGRRLVRGHSTADGPQMLRIVNPEVVLLDLDLHEELAWVAADALLQDENCPPLILLTSNGRQSDFETAIQAGCLIEKTIEPMRLLAVVEQKLISTKADQREQNVLQRLVIRWLKPCSWSTQVKPQNRYWGINE